MTPTEQVDGERARGHRERLADQQERWVGPEPPEGREDGDDRVEVGAEPGDLASRQPGDGEDVAVSRRPDGLDEVADVEAACPERPVLEDGQCREARAEDGRSDRDEPCRPGHPSGTTRSRSARQRAPSTSSDARAW